MVRSRNWFDCQWVDGGQTKTHLLTPLAQGGPLQQTKVQALVSPPYHSRPIIANDDINGIFFLDHFFLNLFYSCICSLLLTNFLLQLFLYILFKIKHAFLDPRGGCFSRAPALHDPGLPTREIADYQP